VWLRQFIHSRRGERVRARGIDLVETEAGRGARVNPWHAACN
jgi:hypothetical protein